MSLKSVSVVVVGILFFATIAFGNGPIPAPEHIEGELWTVDYQREAFRYSWSTPNGEYTFKYENGGIVIYRNGKRFENQDKLLRALPFVPYKNDPYHWLRFPLKPETSYEYTYKFPGFEDNVIEATGTVTIGRTAPVSFNGVLVTAVKLTREEKWNNGGWKNSEYTYIPAHGAVIKAYSENSLYTEYTMKLLKHSRPTGITQAMQ